VTAPRGQGQSGIDGRGGWVVGFAEGATEMDAQVRDVGDAVGCGGGGAGTTAARLD
jgi:hypothetical protein